MPEGKLFCHCRDAWLWVTGGSRALGAAIVKMFAQAGPEWGFFNIKARTKAKIFPLLVAAGNDAIAGMQSCLQVERPSP